MRYEFRPYAKRLFQNQASHKVNLTYRGRIVRLPQTSLRPPYYTSPRYEPYYPLI